MQVVAAESRNKELQEELTATYKEKSRLAEELVLASRQLQIVRDSNEAQVSEGLQQAPLLQKQIPAPNAVQSEAPHHKHSQFFCFTLVGREHSSPQPVELQRP